MKGEQKMKKIIGKIFFLLLLCICISTHEVKGLQNTESEDTKQIIEEQSESLGIDEFIQQAEEYTQDVFQEFDFTELLNSAIAGEIDNKKLGNTLLGLLGDEFLSTIQTIGVIMIIIVIHSILKNITEGLENKSVSKIVYYVQYILIVTIMMTNFVDIITMVKEAIQNLVGFSNALIPVLMTLVLTTGSIASANLMQPILLFMITFIGNIIVQLIIPIILGATVLGIISKVSDKVQLDGLSKFFKTSVVWLIGIMLTLFVGLLSVEGSLSSSVDGITAKTAKAAVSSFIPVVGKILGDAVDTVIGCASILKNAVGIVGVIVIIGICVLPIIKLALLMFAYYLR